MSDEYLIWSNEHRAWWGPNGGGYRQSIADAGTYDRERAISICTSSRDGWGHKAIPPEIPVRLADAVECQARWGEIMNTRKGTHAMTQTVTYAKALSVPEDCDYITEGKLYLATIKSMDGRLFGIICDDGEEAFFDWVNCEFIKGDWQRLEYPYRDPEAVEDLIAAVGEGLAHGFTASRWIDVNATHARLSPADGEVKA